MPAVQRLVRKEEALSGTGFLQWSSPADQCDCWSLSDTMQLNFVNSGYFGERLVDPGRESLWAVKCIEDQ